MTLGRTAIDSNVLTVLLRREPNAQAVAVLLGALRQRTELVICPVVYAELLAGPGATPSHIRQVLLTTNLMLDEVLPLPIWEMSGLAFGHYASRRRASGSSLPRRLMADFLIGAHAVQTCDQLVTLDPQHYRLAFPGLILLTP